MQNSRGARESIPLTAREAGFEPSHLFLCAIIRTAYASIYLKQIKYVVVREEWNDRDGQGE
jgi:hypothetical protein